MQTTASTSQTPETVPALATALSYRSGDGAPRVVAKGRGEIAEQIIAAARSAGIPIQEFRRELVALLMQIELDRHIPPALYQVVAEVLVWARQIDAARHG